MASASSAEPNSRKHAVETPDTELWEISVTLAFSGEQVAAVRLPPTATVRSLRHRIAAAIGQGLPPGPQRAALGLVHEGRALSEHGSLRAAGLSRCCAVEAIRRTVVPVLTASKDWTARVWDAVTGECLLVIEDHQVLDELNMAVISPDNSMLLTACHDCTAKLFDAETGAKLQTFGAPSFQRPRGQHNDREFGHQGPVTVVAFSPDGSTVLSGGDSSVRLWDTATGKAILIIEQPEGVHTVAYTRDGSSFLSASRSSTQVRIFSIETGECTQILSCVDVHSMEERQQGCGCTLSAVTISPDGLLALTVVNRCYTAELWRLDTGERVCIAEFIHDAEVTSVAISADGEWVLTSSLDRTAKLWTIAGRTFGHQVTFKGHKASVNSAAFSQDGCNVLTCSADSTTRLWDSQTGRCLRTFLGHRKSVCSAVFGA